jgi:alpha-ketoglutarate-dependent taurine dioxygenase
MASQRHADAPRLTLAAREALKWLRDQADSGRYSVLMDFRPGDMQFVNNYHVLHGRTPYSDDRTVGKVRHLKRLWLETEVLKERPPHFANRAREHWAQRRVISRLDSVK